MPTGGARTRSGPPPNPNALSRERDAGEWVTLPVAGRAGEPPDWPLIVANDREAELWRRLWAMPQAIMWERQSQEIEVALYVRNLADVERGSSVAAGTLLRQQSEPLGLTTPGLLRNRWRIGRPGEAFAAAGGEVPTEVAPTPARKSSRGRLTVVDGSAA